MTKKNSPELAAWRDLCQRMEAMGERLLDPDFTREPTDRAEGFSHLAGQLVCWLGWANGYGDPLRPHFMRNNDLVTPWGGPNADNVYRHARVDPKHRYRIRGRMNSCEDFVLTLRRGFMHQKVWGTLKEIRAAELGITPGKEFEILLGGDGTEPGWHAIPAEVNSATFREYYFDWRELEPAVFTIECLDPGPTKGRTTSDEVVEQITLAASLVEDSMEYWRTYMDASSAAYPINTFSPVNPNTPWGKGATTGKGLAKARYGHCYYDLAPDEALYVELPAPQADYWSFQLYNQPWFELSDFRDRICGTNHKQAFVSGDGKLRLVVSATDTGAPNWLDSGPRRQGLLTYRCFWPKADPETPVTRLLKASELQGLLPEGEPLTDAAARHEQVEAWRRHLAWRFRT